MHSRGRGGLALAMKVWPQNPLATALTSRPSPRSVSFSTIASPLTRLAWQSKFPMGVHFTVYYDASRVGLGGVLMLKGKTNMVANALSRKKSSMRSLDAIIVEKRPSARDVKRLANSLVWFLISEETRCLISFIEARSSLVEMIRER
ncbi:hypothetical protein MTR67_030704 [Solanum verrucosum]|uniref:Reverse transcriptase/retrotransposon-derived protein RNase H-like domain-containing protein n=1 Tax=Solanum verrucosum TaxID=315347 RepID=A0AAF0R6H8_SOLVR|nr:hypothetical protein MTR67_030704 [Solanum verrucosum]